MPQPALRILLIGGGLLAAAVLLAVVTLSAGGEDDPGYEVRAIFDNAVNVIPGEDVKIAGVRVGTVVSLRVQDNRRAAIVLRIEDPGFQDFRRDASCWISAQSLIGEKFVGCRPTRPRDAGAPSPPLPAIPPGETGAGQHLVPLDQTSSPVDSDLLTNIMRQPGPERLRIILNELGTGLAARGDDLRTAIRRADPALKETDEVLRILASQNRVLAALATDSDAALAPLAAQRRHLTGAIRATGATAQATAQQRAALAENLRRFPAFLRELVPTTDRLGQLADAGTPLMTSLRRAAPGLNRFSVGLKPFAEALQPWMVSLGKTAEHGSKSIVEARPAIDALTALATDAGPTVERLGSFLGDLRYAGGIENFLALIYNGANATNGYDAISHFLRGTLIINPCATYAITPTAGCSANFIDLGSSARTAAGRTGNEPPGDAPRDAGLQRAQLVLRGATPAAALTRYPDTADAGTGSGTGTGTRIGTGTGTGTDAGTGTGTGGDAQPGRLLDYLLGP